MWGPLRCARPIAGFAWAAAPAPGPDPGLTDRSLLAHDVVWAAAGTPHSVFPMAPQDLITNAGATLTDVRER